jgi:hypothetical protein
MDRAAVLALAAVPPALLTACGGAPAAQPVAAPVSDSQWLANIRGAVEQLHADVSLSAYGGADLRSARAALRDESSLYALLLAYSDFGGCSRMIANTGTATRRFDRVQVTLARACGHLEHSATLFTEATTESDAHALLAAGRDVQQAAPLLARAALQLDALRQ